MTCKQRFSMQVEATHSFLELRGEGSSLSSKWSPWNAGVIAQLETGPPPCPFRFTGNKGADEGDRRKGIPRSGHSPVPCTGISPFPNGTCIRKKHWSFAHVINSRVMD